MNKNTTLLSIDEDEKWLANTKELINLNENDRIEIRPAKKKLVTDDNLLGIKYDVKLDGNFGFVLIDGPSLRVGGKKTKTQLIQTYLNLIVFPK